MASRLASVSALNPQRASGSMLKPCFALKVDVDTFDGLDRGVPILLRLLDAFGVRASFFIAMGPDRTGIAALRALRQRGFLSKMIRSRAPALYPWQTMLRGTLLPAKPIAGSLPGRLQEIAAAGHEVGIHGWDHIKWHDRLGRMSTAAVETEVDQALTLFVKILGHAPEGFAAPGWQCTPESLRVIDGRGFMYRSDTRGPNPCFPTGAGYLSSLPEIPTTLPTLDELLGRLGREPGSLAEYYAGLIRWDGLNVHTVHAEIEGGPCQEHLRRLLERLAHERLPVVALETVARQLEGQALPHCELNVGRLPGRGGTVACTGPG